jgi:hypothetical protein
MIPTIGTIISLYAVFRILDTLVQAPQRYPNKGARALLLVVGIIALVLIALCWFDLAIGGSYPSRLP